MSSQNFSIQIDDKLLLRKLYLTQIVIQYRKKKSVP